MARIAFVGSKRLGLRVAEKILDVVQSPHEFVGMLSIDDSIDDRSEVKRFLSFSESTDIPLQFVGGGRATEEALNQLNPELVVVAGWYNLIKLERLPNIRFFGLHGSPLPKYRGNAPIVWQIINGEPNVGLSFFEFSDGIDNGPIVGQKLIDLEENSTIGDILPSVEDAAIELVERFLPQLLDGTAILQPQDEADASYCGLRIPEDGHIDWQWSAERIHNFIRAQSHPYPGAFTYLPDGRCVRIWKSRVESAPHYGVPGGIIYRNRESIGITCGEGAIAVLDAKIEGNSEIPLFECFHSLRLRLK